MTEDVINTEMMASYWHHSLRTDMLRSVCNSDGFQICFRMAAPYAELVEQPISAARIKHRTVRTSTRPVLTASLPLVDINKVSLESKAQHKQSV
jgi:hypothetical protein